MTDVQVERSIGIRRFRLSPSLSIRNIALLFAGGVLVGFGTRYASGCTSGHAITGLSTLQLPSLFAILGIFAGGLLASWFIVPLLLK